MTDGNSLNYMPFFRNYFDIVNRLETNEEQLEMLNCIFRYYFYDKEPTTKNKNIDMAFFCIRHSLDDSKTKALKRAETSRENGRQNKGRNGNQTEEAGEVGKADVYKPTKSEQQYFEDFGMYPKRQK